MPQFFSSCLFSKFKHHVNHFRQRLAGHSQLKNDCVAVLCCRRVARRSCQRSSLFSQLIWFCTHLRHSRRRPSAPHRRAQVGQVARARRRRRQCGPRGRHTTSIRCTTLSETVLRRSASRACRRHAKTDEVARF